jgi:hypothetical protein
VHAAPEYHHREPAERPGVDVPRGRRTCREQSREARSRVRLRVAQQIAEPEPDEQLGLGRPAQERQTGAGRRVLDRREVDVCREILGATAANGSAVTWWPRNARSVPPRRRVP